MKHKVRRSHSQIYLHPDIFGPIHMLTEKVHLLNKEQFGPCPKKNQCFLSGKLNQVNSDATSSFA